jgi:hypothetical protein
MYRNGINRVLAAGNEEPGVGLTDVKGTLIAYRSRKADCLQSSKIIVAVRTLNVWPSGAPICRMQCASKSTVIMRTTSSFLHCDGHHHQGMPGRDGARIRRSCSILRRHSVSSGARRGRVPWPRCGDVILAPYRAPSSESSSSTNCVLFNPNRYLLMCFRGLCKHSVLTLSSDLSQLFTPEPKRPGDWYAQDDGSQSQRTIAPAISQSIV